MHESLIILTLSLNQRKLLVFVFLKHFENFPAAQSNCLKNKLINCWLGEKKGENCDSFHQNKWHVKAKKSSAVGKKNEFPEETNAFQQKLGLIRVVDSALKDFIVLLNVCRSFGVAVNISAWSHALACVDVHAHPHLCVCACVPPQKGVLSVLWVTAALQLLGPGGPFISPSAVLREGRPMGPPPRSPLPQISRLTQISCQLLFLGCAKRVIFCGSLGGRSFSSTHWVTQKLNTSCWCAADSSYGYKRCSGRGRSWDISPRLFSQLWFSDTHLHFADRSADVCLTGGETLMLASLPVWRLRGVGWGVGGWRSLHEYLDVTRSLVDRV